MSKDVDEDFDLSQLPDSRTCPSIVKLYLKVPDLTVIPPIIFECMPLLEVLDLSNTNILSLPSSISSLRSLQELFLRDCPTLIELPSQIGMLTNLKLFDASGTEIMYIPKEIGNLKNLEHLRVSLCSYADDYIKTVSINEDVVPRIMISKLKKLKELCISVSPEAEWWENEVEAIQHELCYLEDLETLRWYLPTTKVLQQFLQLEMNCIPIYAFLSNFILTIGQHAQLTSCLPRNLERKFEEFKKCLKWINGEGNANDICKIMGNAEALFLSRHWTIGELSTCNTTKLKYCLLAECNEMKTLVEADKLYDDVETGMENGEKGGLELLQYLSIHCMKELQSIWKGPIGKDSLSKLMILALHTCPELTTIFTPSIAQNLPCLTELIVEDCPKVKSLVSDEPPNFHSGLLFASLERIILLDLPVLEKLFDGLIILENLHTLLVFNCLNLRRLSIMELPNKEIRGETQWWNDLDCDKSKWKGTFLSLKEKRDLVEQLFEATDSLRHFHDIVLREAKDEPSIIDTSHFPIREEEGLSVSRQDETSVQETASNEIFDQTVYSDIFRKTGSYQNVSSLNATVSVSPSLRVFTLAELKEGTKDFDRLYKIGEGGYGIVYVGMVKSIRHPFDISVAVKRIKRGNQGYKHWVTELNVLGEINHPNLVKLIGYCNEDYGNDSNWILVYEFMPKRSLDIQLSSSTPPSWATRLKIAQDAANGLAYLHEGMGMGTQIIFRDLKPSNILLDGDMNAKLSDFGFAREGPQDGRTHISKMVVGTKGYVAPEYIQTGRLTSKIDVWSYGTVLEELITGQRPLGKITSENNPQFLRWVCCNAGAEKSNLMVDPRLNGNYSERSMAKVEFIVKKCLLKDPMRRPTMREVLEMVKEAIALENQQLPNDGQ